MAIAVTWDEPIYEAGNPPLIGVANRCVTLLRSTSFAWRKYAPSFDAQALIDKISYKNSVPGHPDNGKNYMKMRTGHVTGASVQVIILYHFLSHRHGWGIQIAIDDSILPAPSNGAAPKQDYVDLAKAIAEKMKSDLLSFTPVGTVSYMYEDYNGGADFSNLSATGVNRRRTTKIGELGWAAQFTPTIMGNAGLFKANIKIDEFSTTGSNIPRSLTRAGAQYIVTTELTIN